MGIKPRYDDNYSPVVEKIMKDADDLLNRTWDILLLKHNVDHPYKLSQIKYTKCCKKAADKMIDFMKEGERRFIEGTEKNDCYPDGCITRANRSMALWDRWDMKYKGLIPSWKFYSEI